MNPEETVVKRGKFFLNKNFIELHFLYSKRSDFIYFFPDSQSYDSYMKENAGKIIYIESTEILTSRVRGGIAEVICEETFKDRSIKIMKYKVKVILVNEDNFWKILKEDRILISEK